MASPTLTSEEIERFRDAVRQSHDKAIEILVKYDFINQLVLQDVMNQIESGN